MKLTWCGKGRGSVLLVAKQRQKHLIFQLSLSLKNVTLIKSEALGGMIPSKWEVRFLSLEFYYFCSPVFPCFYNVSDFSPCHLNWKQLSQDCNSYGY